MFKGLVCRLGGQDPVAAGLKEKGAHGKDGFVAVDAEDGFFRTHTYSLLPYTAFWRRSGRWVGSADRLIGRLWRDTGPSTPWSGGSQGRLARQSSKCEGTKISWQPETLFRGDGRGEPDHGGERGRLQAQVARRLLRGV